jgi:hypothetical protein
MENFAAAVDDVRRDPPTVRREKAEHGSELERREDVERDRTKDGSVLVRRID